MPNLTENYGLKKPLPEEFYDIGVQNGNMDIIDKEMKKRIPCLATYYPVNSGKNADDLLDPFALIPVGEDINTELYKIVGGTFAYVWTNFYIEAAVTSRRMQIAMSYNTINHKMAFRIYGANGWLEWKGLANDDDATNIPVSSTVPSDADIWIDPDDENEIITPEKIGAAPAVATSGVYIANGEIATSNGTTRGAGTATVYVSADGFVRVDYMVNIHTAGSTDSTSAGIDINMLRTINPNIPNFAPLHGGDCMYITAERVLAQNANGYGGTHRMLEKRWCWSRVHTTAGAVGVWVDKMFSADTIIRGTCYGKVE